MRRLLVAAALLLSVGMWGCDDDSDSGNNTTVEPVVGTWTANVAIPNITDVNVTQEILGNGTYSYELAGNVLLPVPDTLGMRENGDWLLTDGGDSIQFDPAACQVYSDSLGVWVPNPSCNTHKLQVNITGNSWAVSVPFPGAPFPVPVTFTKQ